MVQNIASQSRNSTAFRFLAPNSSLPTLLLALDNTTAWQDLKRLLEQDYNVIVASDPETALAIVLQEPPNLVLTDMLGSLADGSHLIEQLRGNARTATLPIVVLTPHAAKHAHRLGFGSEQFVFEAGNPGAVLTQVEMQLRVARLHKATAGRWPRQEVEELAKEFVLTKQNLRTSVREIQVILDHTPFLLTHCTRDLRYHHVSRAYARMLGREPEEIAGKPIVEIMGPVGFKTILPYIERVLQGERVEYETGIDFGRVGERLLHVIYTPDRDPHGNVTGWIASILDITEPQRTAEALHQSEAKYHDLFTSLQEGVLLAQLIEDEANHSIDFRYLDINPAAERLIGMKRDTVIGKTARELLPGVSEELLEMYAHSARTGEPFHHEIFEPLQNQYHENFVFCPAPGQIAVLSIDISERKRTERALHESEEKFRTLSQLAPALIWFNDAEGNNRYVNQHYLEFTGKTADQVSGSRWHLVLHPEDADSFLREYLTAVRARQAFHRIFRGQRGDGEWRWLETFARPLFDPQGAYLGHVGVTPDITERKRQEILTNFLADLQDDLARLTSAEEIMQVVGARVGVVLNISASFLVHINEARDEARFQYIWRTGDTPQLPEVACISDFVNEELRKAQRAGEAIQVRDTTTDSRVQADAFRTLNLRSVLSVPFHNEGVWIASLVVCGSQPHDWAADEVQLVCELANRVFPRLARARAEEALQKAHDELEARVAERTRELAEVSRERQSLLHQLLRTQEQERRQLSFELREELAQQLVALGMQLSVLEMELSESDSSTNRLRVMQEQLRKTGGALRSLAMELHPEALELVGLPDTLKKFLQDAVSLYALKIDFQSSGPDMERLPAVVEIVLYRIAQEAVVHLLEHGAESHLSVHLQRQTEEVLLWMAHEPDGLGQPAQRAEERMPALPLIAIRERAALVGGTVEMEFLPSAGMIVQVRIPLREAGQI